MSVVSQMPGDPASPTPAPLFRVLFVCIGNVCRSPVGERLLAARLPADRFEVSSAGVGAMVGYAMSKYAAEELRTYGGDPTGFAARQLTPEMLEQADLVLTAESSHRALLLEEHPGAFRRVFPMAQFAELVEGLPQETGRDLIAAAARSGGPATPAHDIVDPYGRGREAAAASADRLDQLVNTVVRRLREVDVRQ